jgi:hypothetical protein
MLFPISQNKFENVLIKPFLHLTWQKETTTRLCRTYRTVKDGLAVVLVLEKDDLCDGLVGAVRGGYEQRVALTLLTVQGRLEAQHTRELVNAKQRKITTVIIYLRSFFS